MIVTTAAPLAPPGPPGSYIDLDDDGTDELAARRPWRVADYMPPLPPAARVARVERDVKELKAARARAQTATPAGVVGLVVGSQPYETVAGEWRAELRASWQPVTEHTDRSPVAPGLRYEAETLRHPRDEWDGATRTDEPRVVVRGLAPDGTVTVRVRAISVRGVQSGWVYAGPVDLAADTAAPEAPSVPQLTPRPTRLTVAWDGRDFAGAPMVADLAHVEVWTSLTAGFTPGDTTSIMEAKLLPGGGRVQLDGRGYVADTRVRLVAVDKTGNRSAPSSDTAARPGRVFDVDVGSVGADKMRAGTMTADVTLAGRIGTARTGRRAEMDGAGFHSYDADGSVNFRATGGDVRITGEINATSGTVRGNLEVTGAIRVGSARRLVLTRDAAGFGVVRSLLADGSIAGSIAVDRGPGNISEQRILELKAFSAGDPDSQVHDARLTVGSGYRRQGQAYVGAAIEASAEVIDLNGQTRVTLCSRLNVRRSPTGGRAQLLSTDGGDIGSLAFGQSGVLVRSRDDDAYARITALGFDTPSDPTLKSNVRSLCTDPVGDVLTAPAHEYEIGGQAQRGLMADDLPAVLRRRGDDGRWVVDSYGLVATLWGALRVALTRLDDLERR